MERMRRQRGAGTVYQRSSDGRWVGRIEVPTPPGSPRKRKVVYGKTEAEVSVKVDALVVEFYGRIPELADLKPRDVRLRAAREKGRHTRAEWRDKVAALPRVAPYTVACFYCERPVHVSHIEKDHYIPVSRDGSDGLGNLVAACRPCNRGKANMTGDEWFEYLMRPVKVTA